MSTKQKLLRILLQTQEDYISGEEIATALEVSRTAIWKAINELKKEGHHIESSTKKGYRYLPSDVLATEEIELWLNSSLPPLHVMVTPETDSTNKELKLAAIKGAPENTVLTTHNQTETKGRFGRQYFSSAGKGIYMSILLRPDQKFDDVTSYTLISAVAVAQAIEEYVEQPVEIKWVNDLYINGKKVCGILSEALTDFESNSISFVIVGIGLNVSIPQEEFPKEIQNRASSLFPDGHAPISRNRLIASILNHFYELITDLPASNYLEKYKQRSFVLGKQVSFQQKGVLYTGIAQNIGSNGELVVQLENGSKIQLSSGEISLTSIQ